MLIQSLGAINWLEIIRFLDVKSLSSLTCSCKYFKTLIDKRRWEIIDNSIKDYKKQNLIPKNLKTFYKHRYIIDLRLIQAQEIYIPEDVIYNLFPYLNINIIATYQKLSPEALRIYKHHIYTSTLLKHQKLPIDVIKELAVGSDNDTLFWFNLCSNQQLPLDFILEYQDQIHWSALSKNALSITSEVINAYMDKLTWEEITKHGIAEHVILMNIDRMNFFTWDNISYYSVLSRDFIEKYLHNLNILAIIIFQEKSLDEELLIRITNNSKNDTDAIWEKISSYCKLSLHFIEKYKNKLKFIQLVENKHIKRQHLAKVFPDYSG